MVLTKIDIEEIDGYETPKEDNTNNVTCNYMFFIKGFITQINYAFYKSERGQGDSYTDALDDAYLKIYNRFQNKHNLYVDTMIVENYVELESNNKQKGSGCAFYPIEDDAEIFEYLMKNKDEDKEEDKDTDKDKIFQ